MATGRPPHASIVAEDHLLPLTVLADSQRASYSDLGVAARRLIAQHRAQVISGDTADEFFTGLVDRLDTLVDPPITQSITIAQLKRFLPDPGKRIALRDLLDGQVSRLRTVLDERRQRPAGNGDEDFARGHEQVREGADTLLQLLAHGVHLDSDRAHADLWVDTFGN
jgi:hypothetical protein